LSKSIELPPKVAKAFVRDMRAFFKAKDQRDGDEIAARQAWALEQHLPAGQKVRLSDVKQMFHDLKDQA
jgi:hypothetical protein